MARTPRSVIPFRHRIGRSNASSHSDSGRHTFNSATSQRSASIASASARPSEAHVQMRRVPFVDDGASTRAPSESVMYDSRPDGSQDDDTLNEIVMSVDMTPHQTVGCCYYVARDEKLFFMEDIQLGDADVVEALRVFINPTVILVSTKIDDTVIDRFDPEAKNNGSASVDNDQFRLPFLLEVRPPNEFCYDTAKIKLVNLHLGEENGTRVSFNVPGELGAHDHLEEDSVASQQGQLLRLAGWVDIESRTTVHDHRSSMF
jgi:DNA mismatch repair protein MSH5